MYVFPVRYGHDETIKFIFPSKQKDVQKAIDTIRSFPDVERLIVFGSAITLDCGMDSDVDIAVDMPDASEDEFMTVFRALRNSIDGEADILHYNTIHNELLKKEIDRKGVSVYHGNRSKGYAQSGRL